MKQIVQFLSGWGLFAAILLGIIFIANGGVSSTNKARGQTPTFERGQVTQQECVTHPERCGDWKATLDTMREVQPPPEFQVQRTQPAQCLIKGNISFNTGEKIYHVPGGRFYDATTINPSQGERWFCTEAEAIANGWRRSDQ